ncbi:hypothetical protein F5Y08DRAFT_231224 [Xylaria arbuscula]|nr:hypothetical protein F5Y08DRAFT_231224 [Xylaria arbuscula]
MYEPPTAGGAVSAVVQLTSELVTLTTNLRHHLKVMRRAPDEVQSFLMETSNFTCLLNIFTELADRPAQDVERKGQKKRERMIVEIQQQCTYIRDKMEYLVDRFATLAKGNMTPLEGLLERIKYLLDKPDIRDLRLSLQISALTVNCLTTLFWWEEATLKNDTRAASLLEQLKNLLPMAKKASIELAEYQRKHGTSYESGIPGPNNAMLAASEEVLRQIAHVIRLYSHADTAARDRSSSDTRKERRRTSPVIERSRRSEPLMSSPFVTNDVAGDDIEYSPRRRQHRVSFRTSDRTTGLSSHGRGSGTVHDGNVDLAVNSHEIQLPPGKPPSMAGNDANYVAELDAGTTSSNKGVSAQNKQQPSNRQRITS